MLLSNSGIFCPKAQSGQACVGGHHNSRFKGVFVCAHVCMGICVFERNVGRNSQRAGKDTRPFADITAADNNHCVTHQPSAGAEQH